MVFGRARTNRLRGLKNCTPPMSQTAGSRTDGRRPEQLRPFSVTWNPMGFALSSLVVLTGRTAVLCSVCLEDKVPRWRKGEGLGWVSAEYRLLPGSTPQRQSRELMKLSGRTQEIQRLIGRSMRAALDLAKIGPRTVWIDCDVLQADGGTRTASITGGYVALSLALANLKADGLLEVDPIVSPVAAVSVGVVNDVPILDLPYVEDVAAEVDMNLVMNAKGEFIELQGTGEKDTFSDAELASMLAHGRKGINKLLELQKAAISAG